MQVFMLRYQTQTWGH